MPYIKQEFRDYYNNDIDNLVGKIVNYENMGECSYKGSLNYVFIVLALRVSMRLFKKAAYDHINDIMGFFDCSARELYERLRPYEKKKIIENGDLPEFSQFLLRGEEDDE